MSDFEAYARASSAQLLKLAVLLTDRQQDAEDLPRMPFSTCRRAGRRYRKPKT